MVGITERAVQRIVADLVDADYVSRKKEGRKNVYSLTLEKPLRHPVEKNCRISDIVDMIK
jgi:predicted transcriptional regulator